MLAIDKRCLEYDHHWDFEDLYFDDGLDYMSRPDQLDARCTRCGVTMRDSIYQMIVEIKQQMRPN